MSDDGLSFVVEGDKLVLKPSPDWAFHSWDGVVTLEATQKTAARPSSQGASFFCEAELPHFTQKPYLPKGFQNPGQLGKIYLFIEDGPSEKIAPSSAGRFCLRNLRGHFKALVAQPASIPSSPPVFDCVFVRQGVWELQAPLLNTEVLETNGDTKKALDSQESSTKENKTGSPTSPSNQCSFASQIISFEEEKKKLDFEFVEEGGVIEIPVFSNEEKDIQIKLNGYQNNCKHHPQIKVLESSQSQNKPTRSVDRCYKVKSIYSGLCSLFSKYPKKYEVITSSCEKEVISHILVYPKDKVSIQIQNAKHVKSISLNKKTPNKPKKPEITLPNVKISCSIEKKAEKNIIELDLSRFGQLYETLTSMIAALGACKIQWYDLSGRVNLLKGSFSFETSWKRSEKDKSKIVRHWKISIKGDIIDLVLQIDLGLFVKLANQEILNLSGGIKISTKISAQLDYSTGSLEIKPIKGEAEISGVPFRLNMLNYSLVESSIKAKFIWTLHFAVDEERLSIFLESHWAPIILSLQVQSLFGLTFKHDSTLHEGSSPEKRLIFSLPPQEEDDAKKDNDAEKAK